MGVMGLLSLGLVSCSDDESEMTGGGYGLVASTTPQVSDMGIKFPVTELRNGNSTIFKIVYSDGRVVGAEGRWGDYELSFNPLRLTVKDSYDTETFQNFKMDSRGYVTYCESHGSDNDEEESYTWDISSTFAYDGDGHLLLEKSVYTDSDGDDEEYRIVYTWADGNLKSIEETESWSDEDGQDSETNLIEFQYDAEKYQNPGIYYCTDLFYPGELPEFIFYTGMFGRPTNNIPTSYKWTDEMGNMTEVSISGVNYNPDGSVRTINHQRVSGTHYFNDYSYGYEDYPLSALRASAGNSLQRRGTALHRLHEKKRNKDVK